MNANPILLQMKYARIVNLIAEEKRISLKTALDMFYRSKTYGLISQGIADMHCMSDGYLAEDIINEYQKNDERAMESQAR